MKIGCYSILFLVLLGCATKTSVVTDKKVPYDFSKTNERIALPTVLNEISGITFVDSITVLCVQDEDGIIFQYDINKKEITHTYPFGDNGDYEGIALRGDTAYILRSDGTLFEVEHYSADKPKVNVHSTNIPVKNIEGLCFDKKNQRFLIAPKGRTVKGKEGKDIRTIYSYDAVKHQLNTTPVYTLDMNEIRAYVLKNELEVPVKKKKKSPHGEPIIHFRISSLEMHPITKQLYMLSDVDHMIFVYSQAGKLEYAEVLDEDVFNKAEGISFLANGDLIISNEADGRQPTLLKFKYQP